jgi:hypothetical protein
MRYELELRNVPRFRVMEYLTEIGGTPTAELAVEGDGWWAELVEMEPVRITVMEIRRDMLVIEGNDAESVEKVRNFMRMKTMRGGG